MATFIPAIRAMMGDTEYFVSAVTMGEAARMIEYVEQVDGWTIETPSELKLQRKLNVQRVEREMVPYLLSAEDHFYSALTVEIRPAPQHGEEGSILFTPKESFPGDLQFGMLTLDGTETICALDGQHRLKSIALAIRQRPELAREHISLIMVPFKAVTRSQSLFSDLNRYAKGPSKSISILFTHREGLARVAKALAHSVPLLRDRVNMESTSLSSNSRHFITLSTLYEMTKAMVSAQQIEIENNEEAALADLSELWLKLSDAIEPWRLVAKSEEHPAYLRQRYLCMHGVGQQSIALAVATARRELPTSWNKAIDQLIAVDWRLTNEEWQGVALQAGRVNNTVTSIRLLAALLETKMGLSPSNPPQVA
jgi:DNA sulfur modification protein DndB